MITKHCQHDNNQFVTKSKVTQIKIKSKDNNDLSGFESDND